MTTIRFGCLLYAWNASGDQYVGQMPHICERVSQAGFVGIEVEVEMLGAYYDDPEAMQGVLTRYDLELAALALSQDYCHPEETREEREAADRAFEYLDRFAGTQLILFQRPQNDRINLEERQANAIACFHAVARRASERGIITSVHPESSPGSLFRTADDYRRLVQALDPRVLGLALDTGHVVRAGLDVIELLRSYRPLVRHLHFRDIASDGAWCPLGRGAVDFEQIIRLLQDSCYNGWAMVEDASPEAAADPDRFALIDGAYVTEALAPLL